MHLYEIDEDVVALVLRTYASVFDHVAIWYTLGTDVVLLGFKDDARALDVDAVRARASLPDVEAGLHRAGIDSFPALLAHELVPVDVLDSLQLKGDIHSLIHPVLNARAAQAHFRGRQAGLPEMLAPPASAIGVRNSLLGRYVRERGAPLDDDEYRSVALQTCEVRPILCGTVLASWAKDVPGSKTREALRKHLRTEGLLAAHVSKDLQRELELLLGDGAPLAERYTLAQARQYTELYAGHFHYGLPFDREVLDDIWKRCRVGLGIGACYSERLASEARLGPVRAPSHEGPSAVSGQ
jgi:hypothetical protein